MGYVCRDQELHISVDFHSGGTLVKCMRKIFPKFSDFRNRFYSRNITSENTLIFGSVSKLARVKGNCLNQENNTVSGLNWKKVKLGILPQLYAINKSENTLSQSANSLEEGVRLDELVNSLY